MVVKYEQKGGSAWKVWTFELNQEGVLGGTLCTGRMGDGQSGKGRGNLAVNQQIWNIRHVAPGVKNIPSSVFSLPVQSFPHLCPTMAPL